jgi:23S rRNA (cytidine1920-2'-O)/16S rRNA (cytidine1409-2'-O)-methyltransferase
MARTSKQRLDILLVERGLAESRSLAQRLILAGKVRVDGETKRQPGRAVPVSAGIELVAPPPYASRGGEKLAAALESFRISPQGWICADAGASTGGFTDCLLQHGAAKVYAIDVGKGILDWKLRNDPRVTVMEGRNVRFVETLPEPVRLATADLAFISLRLVFPVFRGWMGPDGQAVVLIKPQFEAGRKSVGRGGVVKDPAVHRSVLESVLRSARDAGFSVAGLIRSPLKGPAGNVEFLAHLPCGEQKADAETIRRLVDAVVEDPSSRTGSTSEQDSPHREQEDVDGRR